ncbi:hypothetical protein DM02DRAFT_729427 [Periconia macrospinosa]|uniref:Uncharacterized protein n=1 Tax=Periconia macrospinosa TaxID=97972 RepID=A0A2V1DLN7_9PLEO|nr:hypothetical protein DM02DRAFT_729427 [Periconia macrospinosa]
MPGAAVASGITACFQTMESCRSEQADQVKASPSSLNIHRDASTEYAAFHFTTIKDDMDGLKGRLADPISPDIDALNDYIVQLSKDNTATIEEYSKLANENAKLTHRIADLHKEQNKWGYHQARKMKELADAKEKLAQLLETNSQLKVENTTYLEDAISKDRKIIQQQAEIKRLQFAVDERVAVQEKMGSRSRHNSPRNAPKSESADHERVEYLHRGSDSYRPVSDPRSKERKKDHSQFSGS